jgi:transcription-repair coupling factor (superfamily II helicase)
VSTSEARSYTGLHPGSWWNLGRCAAVAVFLKDTMDLTGLLPALLAEPAAAAAIELVRGRGAVDLVGPAGVRPPLLAALAGARPRGRKDGSDRAPIAPPLVVSATGRPLVVVTATGRDADELGEALRCYLAPDAVAVLPSCMSASRSRRPSVSSPLNASLAPTNGSNATAR